MKARGILLTLVVILGLLFALLNWQTLFEPTTVNLLLGSVRIPLGITLLAIALVVSLLFFLASLWERAGQLRQVTHQERIIEGLQAKLDKQRSDEVTALDSATRDRFDGLRQQLESDGGRLETNLTAALAELEERQSLRLEQMEQRQAERIAVLQERVVLVRNELSADIGELENRLEGHLATGEPKVG